MKRVLLGYLCIAPLVLSAQILFENQAAQLGVPLTYGSGSLAGGVSFYDYNQDGWDDITMASEFGEEFHFYKNVGGSFIEDDLDLFGGNQKTRQITWVDYDNDGDLDFFSASDSGLSRLFRNDGDNTFVDVTDSCGLPTVEYDTIGGSWGDYNNDSYLDLFISILDVTQQTPNFLFKNNGDGTFTDVTETAGLHLDGFLTFCVAWFDYDKDGYQDIYMANDRYHTSNILYRNNGDGTFTDTSAQAGADLFMGAMSTTIDDYNNDGWLDIYITNDDQVIDGATVGNAFLENNGDGTFTNVAIPTGTQFNSVGWGSVFLDADNDQDHDLYVSSTKTGENGFLPSAFYENDGEGVYSIPENIGFEEDTMHSYANAIGDVDNDGFPEIAVVNAHGEELFLWKNLSSSDNNWLKVNLRGTSSNSMGIGSWIEISASNQKQYHYTLCGEGFIAQNSGTEFFGLGSATVIDYVKVTWLSGQVDYIEDIDVNQTLEIVEGSNPLNVEDVFKPQVQIMPNPAQDYILINTKDMVDKGHIDIYTSEGRILTSLSLSEDVQKVDINNFMTGLLLVKWTNGKGSSVHKLIKQ